MHSGVRNFILFVILVVLYCMFMAVSALILIQVEEPFEKDWRHKITQLKSRITANHCISNDELEGNLTTKSALQSKLIILFKTSVEMSILFTLAGYFCEKKFKVVYLYHWCPRLKYLIFTIV